MARNIFEAASIGKIRFETTRGLITTEDLWDLPMTRGVVNLNDIAKKLHEELSKSNFSLSKTTKKDRVVELKFEIVKHIFDIKAEEVEAEKAAAAKAEKREVLLNAIADKEVEELVDGKSAKELKKELKNL